MLPNLRRSSRPRTWHFEDQTRTSYMLAMPGSRWWCLAATDKYLQFWQDILVLEAVPVSGMVKFCRTEEVGSSRVAFNGLHGYRSLPISDFLNRYEPWYEGCKNVAELHAQF